MTQEEIKKVKSWLYSIRRSEIAFANLTKALEELESRNCSPPTWMKAPPEAVMVSGSMGGSKQEAWTEFLDEYPARKSFLEDNIRKHELKINCFWKTQDALAEEDNIGAQAIRKKYYDKVRPDRAIYTMFIFCTPETYYRSLRRALQFYYDVLPDIFQGDRKLTVS